MIFITENTEQTKKVGYDIASALDKKGIRRKFIALRGEMGVGKTAFTSGFASYFEISGVRSPTYTVVNQYGTTKKIYHFDMYRIADEDDLYSIGYDDYLESDGYMIVEWSENIEYAIPSDALYVSIERTPEDENQRKITVSPEIDL